MHVIILILLGIHESRFSKISKMTLSKPSHVNIIRFNTGQSPSNLNNTNNEILQGLLTTIDVAGAILCCYPSHIRPPLAE